MQTNPARVLEALAWARINLPDQEEAFVASSYLTLKAFGQEPSKQAVLERLEAQGRRVTGTQASPES